MPKSLTRLPIRTFAVIALLAASSRLVFACPPPPGSLDQLANIERSIAGEIAAGAPESPDPKRLLGLSGLYLDLGGVLPDAEKRIAAYDEGARLAQRALELKEDDPEAHFLYAANIGNAAEIKGVTASLLSLEDMRVHVRRMLDLQKDHVGALQMGGMMLDGLPAWLGGNPAAGLDYVRRAVALDPGYTEARLNLAKMYIKRNQAEPARSELLEILKGDRLRDPYEWAAHHCPQAQKLLDSLPKKTP